MDTLTSKVSNYLVTATIQFETKQKALTKIEAKQIISNMLNEAWVKIDEVCVENLDED